MKLANVPYRRVSLPPIRVGVGGPVTVRVRGILDGETVFDREGHSLLANFLHLLYSKMVGGMSDDADFGNRIRGIYPTSDQFQTTVLSATQASPCQVVLDEGEGWTTTTEEARRKAISGAQGMTEINLDEVFLDYVSPSVYNLYTGGVGLTPVDTSLASAYVANSARVMAYDFIHPTGSSTTFDVLNSDLYGIRLGTGTKAVAIDDFHMDRIDYLMTRGSQTVAAPAVDTVNETSTIVFTRQFTNNSGGPITAYEVALFCQIGNHSNSHPCMISRDLIAGGQTIPDGSEFTMEYEIVTSLENLTPPYGGVLRQLGEMLYRQFNQTNRTVQSWVNGNISEGPSNNHMRATFPGGFSGTFYTNHTDWGWPFGPLLGTDDGTLNPLGIDNFGLNSGVDDTLIYYGKGDGPNGIKELRYFPCIVEDYQVSGGVASFHVVRPALNLSGSAITVKEGGLLLSGDAWSDIGISWNARHFVTRHILQTPVTINDGEMVLIDQEFALQVA